ncbi:MAG: extracellular solute-binding protein [Oscillospiraceae bacterium]
MKLDPNNPVSITLWHYYNGSQKNALTDMVEEFNKTDGRDKGIVVEAVNLGSITELKNSILDSAAGKVGSDPVPNIFAAYADTAYQIDSMGLVTDLSQYPTQAEIDSYIPSYIEEGPDGQGQRLKIFPLPNPRRCSCSTVPTGTPLPRRPGRISAICPPSRVTATAKAYYEWTDSLTPEVKDDGKAFFGRDAVANYFIIGLPPAGGGNLPGQGRRGHLPAGGEHAAQVMG